jgi:hypothetical protein
MNEFYKGLAVAVVNFRDRNYWRYQTDRLTELGLKLDWFKLTAAVCRKIVSLAFNPSETWKRISRRLGRGTAQSKAPQLSKVGGA